VVVLGGSLVVDVDSMVVVGDVLDVAGGVVDCVVVVAVVGC
jgi:hypothetical protein